VLDLSPREAVAREKVAAIRSLRRKRALEAMAAEVETLVRGEEWDMAAEVYGRLVELDPEDQRWSEGLNQVEKERGLARRYAEGLGAMQQIKWAEAQRAFADVAYERPTYKDAAELLAGATRQGKSEPAAAEIKPKAQLAIPGCRWMRMAMIAAVPLLLLGFGTWVGTARLFRTQTQATSDLSRPPPSTPPPPASSVLSPAPSLPTPHTLTGHTNTVYNVTFNRNGNLLASGSADQTVRLWQTTDGSQVRELTGHTDSVRGIAFSPDGRLLASASDDRTIRLWKVGDGSLVRELKGHILSVWSVAFSPDGQLLASASGDRTIRLWKVGDGSLVRELTGHILSVWSVAFSPD
jgi:hypothetical protein